jgi:HEAT repeats
MKASYRSLLMGALVMGATCLFATGSAAETPTSQSIYAGRASVYRNLAPNSLEDVSSPQEIEAATSPNAAPIQVWEALEHGEKVECLDCIPDVAKLLYNQDTHTREIAAWWLRRRIFGVYGPGQVYTQVLATLSDQGQPAQTRADAAQALGEFLVEAGVAPVANALITDPSAVVRKAAALALKRLDNQGPNDEIAQAMSDSDTDVRLAALDAAVHVNVFTGVDSVVKLISDPSPLVRRRAAEDLGVMRASDAVVGLVALTSPKTESSADVRAAAVAALGQIADPGGKAAVQAALNDPNGFVRDAATIALRRL